MSHSQGLSNNPYPALNQFLVLIPISLRYIPLLSSHLILDLPKSLFPVSLPVKILEGLLPSSILATFPAHLNFLDLITLTILGERYKPFSYLLSPNTRIRILFSNTLCLHSSFNVRDHVSQPYSTTGNIIIFYIFYIFLEKEKSIWTE